MSISKRRKLFGEKIIHLVHDRKSKDRHPFPIMEEITDWDEGQISLYLDCFSYRFMHDQSWIPDNAFPRKPTNHGHGKKGKKKKGKKALPELTREDIVDDGRYEILHEELKLEKDKKLQPVPVSTSNQNSKSKKGVPKKDVPKKDKEPWIPWANGLDRCTGKIRNEKTLDEFRDTPNLRLRAATIEQMLFNRTRNPSHESQRVSRATVNFLDIPCSLNQSVAIPVVGLDSFPNLQSHNRPDYSFATEVPHADFRWALNASEGAISDSHMDTGGFATHVRIVLGKKLWFIGIPDSYSPNEICTKRKLEEKFNLAVENLLKSGNLTSEVLKKKVQEFRGENSVFKPFISTLEGFVDRALTWYLVVLEPGDDL